MICSLSLGHHAQTIGWTSDAQDTQNVKHYGSFKVVICQTPSWKKKAKLNYFFSTRLLQGDCTWINTISPALGFWSLGSPCRRPEGRHFLTGRWIWKNYILPHWGSWWWSEGVKLLKSSLHGEHVPAFIAHVVSLILQYFSHTGADDRARDGQEVARVSSFRNVISGQLRTHR